MPDVTVLALLAHDRDYARYVARVPVSGQTQGPYFGNFDAGHDSVTGLLDRAYGSGLWELQYQDAPWALVADGEAVREQGEPRTVHVAADADGLWHGRSPGVPFLRETSFPLLQQAAERVHATTGDVGKLSYYFTTLERLPYA